MAEKIKLTGMQLSIWFSFIYIVLYVCGILFNASDTFVYVLFAGWPFVIIWVVVSILKDKHEPQKTFKDYFYQDEEMKRIH
jgi:hypothetical protein